MNTTNDPITKDPADALTKQIHTLAQGRDVTKNGPGFERLSQQLVTSCTVSGLGTLKIQVDYIQK
jgi:hypothetical protein